MTPTTTEREARELLAREYERSGYAPSGIREGDRAVVLCDAAIRAIIAALTREQREGDAEKRVWQLWNGMYRMFNFGRDNNTVSAQCEVQVLADFLAGKDIPAWNHPVPKPQQEAQGAVACKNPCLPWDFFNARACQKCVHEKFSPAAWRDHAPHAAAPAPKPTITLNATTQPAPVDVRGLRALANDLRNEAGDWDTGSTRGALKDAANRIDAILDGQPAGVDDEMSRMDAVIAAHKTWPTDLRKKLSLHDLRRMSGWAPKPSPRDWRIDTSAGVPILVYQNCSVIEGEQARYVIGLIEKDGQQGLVIDDAKVRRAVCAYDEWMIEHAPDETDAYHDGMRAALTAALGGGGKGA